MSTRSLRFRISVWTASVTTFALIVLAASTVIYVYFEDLEAIDEHLRGEALELAADISHDQFEPEDFQEDEFEPWLGLALLTTERQIIGRTPSFPSPVIRSASGFEGLRFEKSADQNWRVFVMSSGEHVIVVGHNLEEFRDVLLDLITAEVVLLPFVTALTAWISWLVAGRSLKPIRDATAAAAHIGAGELSQRLPTSGNDDEIARFTEVLNAMLERIEKSYLQAKRFAGDASHELSTPLTVIKGEIERMLETHQLGPSAESGLLSAQQEVDRMHQIIDQLLLLARFDAGRSSPEKTTFDLSAMLGEMAEDVDLLSAERELTVTANIEPHLMILGDPSQIRRLLLNLLANAVKYNRDAGRLDYTLQASGDHAQFIIRNTGNPIPADAMPRLFDRFFQVDQSHASRGSGLGLSLCREIARDHGGEVELVPDPEGLIRFEVTIPRVHAAPTAV
ncbi:ATP-binding protein [Synoicihabitans lomoniglobus]|nr:ATP-binding protein [Opitutaceae bacterium LMO-M01]